MTTGATSERTPAATLGEQIKGLRASRRIGLAEAARQANVAKSTLSDWEHGRKSPSGPALERLLDALDADARLRAHLLVDANPGYARWALGDLALGVPVHVGRMLRALRIRLGLTQSGVASRVGVTQSAVAKWESGDSRLEGTALHNVCFALGASPEECTAITTAREPTSGGAEDLDYIERRWEIERLPPRLRPVMRLGLEADLWKLAARNPIWDGPLCWIMAQRVYDARLMCRYDEIEVEAKAVFRLAKSSGTWAEATPAFIALDNVWKRKGMPLARRASRLERWTDRLPDNAHRLWPMAVIAENRAALGDEKGAVNLIRHVRNRHADFGPKNEFHDRQAIAGVRLAAGNGAATLDALGDDDLASMMVMRAEATMLMGQEPDPEWIARIRAYVATEGMPFNQERLESIESNIARMRRGRPIVPY